MEITHRSSTDKASVGVLVNLPSGFWLCLVIMLTHVDEPKVTASLNCKYRFYFHCWKSTNAAVVMGADYLDRCFCNNY